MENNHGGPREGAGRRPGENSRSIPRAIRVSSAVDAYLRLHGTGLIEDLIRRSKAFRKWVKSQKPDA